MGRKGSHVRLKKKTPTKTYIVVVPMHPEIKKGTLNLIEKVNGKTRDPPTLIYPHLSTVIYALARSPFTQFLK